MLEVNPGLLRLWDRQSEALTTQLDLIHHHTRLDLILRSARSQPNLDQQNILSHVFKSDLRTIIHFVIRPQIFSKHANFYFAEILII
jgi:hypothetical protein